MIYVVACMAISVFMAALALLRIVSIAQSAITTSRTVSRTLQDLNLSDEYREKAMRQASLALLCNFVSITIRGALALMLSYLTLGAADKTGLARTEDVITLLSDWETIVITSVVISVSWFIWHKS